MPKRTKTSAKKRLPKLNSERPRTASPSHAAVTKIDLSKQKSPESKQSHVIAMLRSPGGATIAAIMHETDWQQHSVRGFLAGVVRKRLKFKLQSKKIDGHRVYHIAGEGSLRGQIS